MLCGVASSQYMQILNTSALWLISTGDCYFPRERPCLLMGDLYFSSFCNVYMLCIDNFEYVYIRLYIHINILHTRSLPHTHTHTHTYIHIHIWMCMCAKTLRFLTKKSLPENAFVYYRILVWKQTHIFTHISYFKRS